MESPGGMSDGGVGIEPWQIPKMGAGGVGSSNQRSLGESRASGSLAPTSQGNSSTGVGGLFAQGAWPGKMAPAWHRGFYGGPGIRTGGYG